jgi:hypothetical protein
MAAVLRILANVAALLGLGALGAAIGDFASAPSVLGAVGLGLAVVLVAAALHRLYRPGGVAAWRAAPRRAAAPEPERPPEPRRRSSPRPTSAPLWLDDD